MRLHHPSSRPMDRSGRLQESPPAPIAMIRRLEQVAALVVAAGLALVSYWLFFSWARGGGAEHRLPARRTSMVGMPAPPSALAATGNRRFLGPLHPSSDGFKDRRGP
jgi:hypothetical protein